MSGQPRNRKRALLITFDTMALVALAWLSYFIRFGSQFLPNVEQSLMILLAPVVAIPVFARMGLYRAILRYLPDRAVWTILRAVTVAVLIWVFVAFLTRITGAEGIPRSVPIIYWTMAVFVIAASRFSARWLLWESTRSVSRLKQTLIYGAGEAGTQLANALISSRERFVAGFLSDDRSTQGLDLLGIRVYPTQELNSLVANIGIDEVIITMPDLSGQRRRELMTVLTGLPVKVRILPPIGEMASGKHLISHVRDIDIEDLLGRDTVPANPALLREMIEGKVILISGGAGSIGSALSRGIAEFRPASIVLLDTNEHGLFQIHREVAQMTDSAVFPVLGSVSDRQLVDRVLKEFEVDTVYHCAAYKHVALVERNVIEAIRNNVLGTLTLVEAAGASAVDNFILISSDKAVRPASVMGATKRWAELIVRHYSKRLPVEGGCKFTTVRFGNVLGSSGSVVPLFREQIGNGGPVTLTDENMTRYFMSVGEAADLIVQAGGLSHNGDILVLEMGQPIRIRDLAENMIMLAGLSIRSDDNPDGDIEIVTIGACPGEKLQEELFYDGGSVTPTSNPRILRAKQLEGVADKVPAMLDALQAALAAGDVDKAKALLFSSLD